MNICSIKKRYDLRRRSEFFHSVICSHYLCLFTFLSLSLLFLSFYFYFYSTLLLPFYISFLFSLSYSFLILAFLFPLEIFVSVSFLLFFFAFYLLLNTFNLLYLRILNKICHYIFYGVLVIRHGEAMDPRKLFPIGRLSDNLVHSL